MTPARLEWNKKNRERLNATRRAWADRNQDKVKASRRQWRLNNKERDHEIQKSWRDRNANKIREYRSRVKENRKSVVRARRNKPRGRVCDSCGRSDSEATWTDKLNLCATCEARSRRNGFCGNCGRAKNRPHPRDHMGSGCERGKPYCPDCREAKSVFRSTRGIRVATSTRLLTLWDMLWTAEDPNRLTWSNYASLSKTDTPTAKRFWGRFMPWIEEFAGVTREYDDIGTATIVIDGKALMRKLEPLVNAVSGVV